MLNYAEASKAAAHRPEAPGRERLRMQKINRLSGRKTCSQLYNLLPTFCYLMLLRRRGGYPQRKYKGGLQLPESRVSMFSVRAAIDTKQNRVPSIGCSSCIPETTMTAALRVSDCDEPGVRHSCPTRFVISDIGSRVLPRRLSRYVRDRAVPKAAELRYGVQGLWARQWSSCAIAVGSRQLPFRYRMPRSCTSTWANSNHRLPPHTTISAEKFSGSSRD